MAELIYPVAGVRTLGQLREGRLCEILPVVEDNGVVYGRAERQYCHKNALLHPVVHLHIIDRFGRLYLQKRSATKDLCPSMWDTAVGGHVCFGEQAIESLYREASEELGLNEFNPIQVSDYIWENGNDRELVIAYATVGSFDLDPDNSEVEQGRYWEMADIEDAIGKNILTPQFEMEFRTIKTKLLSLL